MKILAPNEAGQTLLEITVVIGVAVIAISALTMTTLIGLRNSQFSQNQIQATKLAQEGLEKIKEMREKNIPICNNSGVQSYFWREEGGSQNIWQNSITSVDGFIFLDITQSLSPPYDCELSARANDVNWEGLIDGRFSRKIFIDDPANDEKKITAIVSWSDVSGTHQSESTTILTSANF